MSTSYSDYWLDELNWDLDTDSSTELSNVQLLKLSSARKAVKNYVSILSGKNIPVKFAGTTSYTDGQTIVISSDIVSRKNFDVNVGLTLHETSHIVYSDFEMLSNIWMMIPDNIHELSERLGITKSELISYTSFVFNFVEDRYVDYMVTKSCPGYFPYYRALYDKYFDSPTIGTSLKSNLYRTSTLESYIYRMTNITNKHSDLSALPGLKRIYDTIDLKNISRLRDTKDRLECAFDVFSIILTKIEDQTRKTVNDQLNSLQSEFDQMSNIRISANSSSSETGDSGSETGDSGDSGDSGSETGDSGDSGSETGDGGDSGSETGDGGDSGSETGDGGDSGSDVGNGISSPSSKLLDNLIGGSRISINTKSKSNIIDDIGEDSDLSDSYVKRIKNSFEKQKDLLTGNVKKKKLKSNIKNQIDILEENGVEIIKVGSDFFTRRRGDDGIKHTTECVFAKTVTEEFLSDSKNFPLSIGHNKYSEQIRKGIRMGTRIGRQLQIRNQEVIEKYTRRAVGKLDRKLLKEAVIGNDNLFYTTSCTKYKKTHVHIDIDMSSSMDGTKYENSLVLLVAICKSFTMLNDVDVRVCMRAANGNRPYYAVVYDSNVDSFSKIINKFAAIGPNGTTPEGLCFEAGMKLLSKERRDTNKLFINISDGMPYFQTIDYDNNISCRFEHEPAVEYTRGQVNKIRNLGYEIISYFVSDSVDMYANAGTVRDFKRMYGESAEFINILNVNSIIDTLNKKLTERYTV